MGVLARPKPVKLVVSLIFREAEKLELAEKELRDIYGPTEKVEKTLPFDYTDYYYEEFGRPLSRKLLSFRELLSAGDVSGTKLRTNDIEDQYRTDGKRTVNIDPGYVTEAKLVLLTTKDYTHRVHIGSGIFAESTLFYRDGTFRPWRWTYPDYASPEVVSYFNEVRETYVGQLKA